MSAAALHPLERGYLYAYGILKFPPANQAKTLPRGARKKPGEWGRIKRLALAFVAEHDDNGPLVEYCRQHRINYESIQSTIWKLRHPKPNKAA